MSMTIQKKYFLDEEDADKLCTELMNRAWKFQENGLDTTLGKEVEKVLAVISEMNLDKDELIEFLISRIIAHQRTW